ncbi:uncharacterized protein LAESUDRAFT_786736 [Laetiporus sulphureus 93-53]|uniref:CHAT domain-containing protein n=1 Tax=Laetiporus sulphureus 93-53 TaxID=1314785 RepID=A0A165D2A8_9APHY|nr:uncharacterized protein LAESUDRAFT_786736 [Laetiporus sulphureus 93-53]KZT04011.1 hypothetical protein LAESUDRAFT_786736 [Laetiporus sulphureus 93-53]
MMPVFASNTEIPSTGTHTPSSILRSVSSQSGRRIRSRGFRITESSRKIQNALVCSPVVILNRNYYDGVDALVLRKGHQDVLHVPTKISFETVEQFRRQLGFSRPEWPYRNDRPAKMVDTNGHPLGALADVLSKLWELLVQPILKALSIVPADVCTDPPRLWFCPISILAFMPLHAAGDYSKGGIGHKISDYVIPSYTSTLAALSPPKPLPSSNKPISVLAVSQSQSGACHSYLYPALPNAQEEVCKIEQIASHFKIASQVLQDSAGTV